MKRNYVLKSRKSRGFESPLLGGQAEVVGEGRWRHREVNSANALKFQQFVCTHDNGHNN